MQWTGTHPNWVVTRTCGNGDGCRLKRPIGIPSNSRGVNEPNSIRVLVVDDHPGSTQPDVTLMDIKMPDMSGIDAIIAIREEYPDARIVVLNRTHAVTSALRRGIIQL
ncbi:MAG: LuxR family transcriptional regulator [Gammaproteobacteria bacterium]|jgi:hypothetical protein|nr:LuxR family transcriptional regulator [Gammaproteobacteria bacterium]